MWRCSADTVLHLCCTDTCLHVSLTLPRLPLPLPLPLLPVMAMLLPLLPVMAIPVHRLHLNWTRLHILLFQASTIVFCDGHKQTLL